MSLRFAILVSLESAPRTGYEIAREFDSGVGHFWYATHQQIYRELSKLSDTGAVSVEHIPQDTKPAKKRYRLTKRGRDDLQTFLVKPAGLPPVRDALLVKLSAGHLADPNALVAEINAMQAQYRQRLDEYLSYEQIFQKKKAQVTVKQEFLYLTLRRGITAAEAWLAWSDEVITYLKTATARKS